MCAQVSVWIPKGLKELSPYEIVPVNACSLAQRNTPRILLCGFRNHLEDDGPPVSLFLPGRFFPKTLFYSLQKKRKKRKKKRKKQNASLVSFLSKKLYRLKFLLTPLQKGKKEIRILRTVLAGGRRGPSRVRARRTDLQHPGICGARWPL